MLMGYCEISSSRAVWHQLDGKRTQGYKVFLTIYLLDKCQFCTVHRMCNRIQHNITSPPKTYSRAFGPPRRQLIPPDKKQTIVFSRLCSDYNTESKGYKVNVCLKGQSFIALTQFLKDLHLTVAIQFYKKLKPPYT